MAELPPDFEPSLLTRLRLWRKHAAVHERLKAILIRTGHPGDTTRCVHCGRQWTLRDGGAGPWVDEGIHKRKGLYQ